MLTAIGCEHEFFKSLDGNIQYRQINNQYIHYSQQAIEHAGRELLPKLKDVAAAVEQHGVFSMQDILAQLKSTNNLKNAINKTANALFIARDKRIWGEMPIAIASDSTQFSAYFQNMTSEYHNRYGGRGVMIYWHVEKKATCIHSQLKSDTK